MTEFSRIARQLGGVARTSELARTPAQRRALERAATRGEVNRLRRGVYGVGDLDPDVADAARVGGRVAGVSCLRHYGLWVPPGVSSTLHVEVPDEIVARPQNVAHKRVQVHWIAARSIPRFGITPLDAALGRAADALPRPFAVAVLDSALRATPLTPVELAFRAELWRPAARAAVRLTDERSESGTESVLRVLLHQAGISATPQPRLPLSDGERADLLVGDCLLIECDSEAHHASPSQRRADLRRDEWLSALGFRVLRVDYRQVFDDPKGVVATIAAMVERGEHLSRPPGR